MRFHFFKNVVVRPLNDYSPFRHGGLSTAHQFFGEQLARLLDELNEVLAA